MRRRQWLAVVALGGIILAFAACWPSPEPQYRGKPLSVWLKGFESETMAGRLQSAEALRQIGTNALPQLISLLHQPYSCQESRWRHKLRALLAKQSLIKITIPRPSDNRAIALAALDALGPRAKNAVPALEGLLQEVPPDYRALIVLAGIGPEAFPVLNRALTNEEKAVRLGARVCLDRQQTHRVSFSQSGEDSEFMRRTCEFNVQVIRAALADYQVQHPEQFTADGKPRPMLPSGFTPPELAETNAVIVPLQGTRPGYE